LAFALAGTGFTGELAAAPLFAVTATGLAGAGWTETVAGFDAAAGAVLAGLGCAAVWGTAFTVAAEGLAVGFTATVFVCASVALVMINKNARFRFIGFCLCL